MQKERLSLVVTHNDFKDEDGEVLELYIVKKHFKVEMEGDPDYFFDEVAKNDNKQPEEEVLPQVVINNEEMGVNDGGPQNLAAALNGVVDIDYDNEPAQKMFQHLKSTQIQCCLLNGVMWVYVINNNKAIQIARPNCQILLTSLRMTSMSSCLRGSFPNSSSMM